jgi:hypothetical protein
MKKDENNVGNISERYETFVVLFSSSFLSSSTSPFCVCEPKKDKSGIEMRNYCTVKATNYKWMRSSWVVRASDCRCRSWNSPGIDPSILRHSGIWGAAVEAVLNKVHKKSNCKKVILNIPFVHNILQTKDETADPACLHIVASWWFSISAADSELSHL